MSIRVSKELFVPTIYLDECGYTGEDLLYADQPIFSLASLSCSDDEAIHAKKCFFGKFQGPALKHTTLTKSKRHQDAIVDFVTSLIAGPINSKGFFACKKFVASGKMIDLMVEQAMAAEGLDLYENGGNMALSNLTYYGLHTAFGMQKFEFTLSKFIAALRTRERKDYEEYISTLKQFVTESQHREMAEWITSHILISHEKLGYDGLIAGLPPNVLDLSLDFAIETACHWRTKYGDQAEIEIIHDQSSNMAKQTPTWKILLDDSVPSAIVGYDRRTRKFPVGIKKIRFASDHECPGLQLADVFAGAIAHGARWLFIRRDPADVYGEKIGKLISRQCEELGVHGIFPSKDFTPEALGSLGPKFVDPHDFTAFVLMNNRQEPEDGS